MVVWLVPASKFVKFARGADGHWKNDAVNDGSFDRRRVNDVDSDVFL